MCVAADGREFDRMRGEFVDVGGTRMYYFAAGTRGAGDPVVLLHGFPGSSHAWRRVVPLLPEGRRVVVVDLMGCGRSDAPASPADAFLDRHAAMIVGLLDDLRIESTALVGHGYGGAIAMSIAAASPARISALGVLSAPAFEAWPRRHARLARAAIPFARVIGAPMLAGFVHGSALRGFVDRDAGRRALDHALQAYPSRLGTAAIVSHLRAMRDSAIPRLAPQLGAIAAPTAVIWGADDPFLPPAVGARLRDAIPGATLDVIPGARHFLAEDVPERCATAITALLDRSRNRSTESTVS